MSILEQTKNQLPLFGKYIPKEKRQQRFLIIFIVFIIFEIIQSISFFYLKVSVLHFISLIPIALSGFLLGVYVPVFIGLLSNYVMGILMGLAGASNLNPPFQFLTMGMIVIGTVIGILMDNFRKSTVLKKALTNEQESHYQEESPLWGRYLSPQKRKKRLVLFFVIFVIYIIIQVLLFIRVRRGIIFSLNIIPIAISGWLLGIYGPIMTGLLTDFFLVLIVRTTGFQDTDSMIGIFQTIITILIGCVIGKLSELIDKSRITEEEIKKSKEEAERANRAKSEFLACMSHEIRTPINSIMGFAQLLKEDLEESRHIERIDIILKSGNTLLTLINDILDLSKIEAGELEIMEEAFSLRCILIPLQNIFSLKAREKKLEFTITIDDSVPETLLGDEHRIQQIVSNLIHNAVKFTEKGSIRVDVIYTKNAVPDLVIRVHDTGIGIPRDLHEAIFTVFKRGDPSLTRIYSGTGLGLAITKRLVEQMGGRIVVESAPGEGSRFIVYLPLKAIEKRRNRREMDGVSNYQYTAETVRSFINNGITCTILVAEDNESNRMYIRELLVRVGINCDFVKDGQETINLLEKKAAEGHMYDLLILDIQMPVLSGLDVITHIRKSATLKDIYCIAVTAHALKGDEKKYLDAGCDAYIAKPIEIHELYKHIIYRLELISELSPEKFSGKTESPLHSSHITKMESIEAENRDEIENLIARLRNNYKIYNKQELLQIQKDCRKFLPEKMGLFVDLKIQHSIKSYDDEILLEIIELLEFAVSDQHSQVPS